MLKNIILLTGQAAQQVALTALLREHNPKLTFRYALTADDLSKIDLETLANSRLLAFTSGTIVPHDMLRALGHGAYNFHPGSPDRPGWAPAHFAIYEGAKIFGATAHMMIESVDAGPIVGTETFEIPPQVSVRELEQIAFVRLAYLFWRLSGRLATQNEPLQVLPIHWSGRKSTRRMYESMCDIPVNIAKDELERRVRIFSDDFRGIYPTVRVHGFKFRIADVNFTAQAAPVPKSPAFVPPVIPAPSIGMTRAH